MRFVSKAIVLILTYGLIFPSLFAHPFDNPYEGHLLEEARSLLDSQEFQKAEENLKEALANLAQNEQPELAFEAMSLLIESYKVTGERELEKEYLDQRIRFADAEFGPTHPKTNLARLDIGSWLRRSARRDSAIHYLKGFPTKLQGPENLENLTHCYLLLGRCYHDLNRYEEAEAILSMGLEVSENKKIQLYFLRSFLLEERAFVHSEIGMFDKAIHDGQQNIKSFESRPSKSRRDSIRLADTHRIIGGIYWDYGNYSQALDHEKLAIALGEQIRNMPPAVMAKMILNHANTYFSLSKYETALKLAKEAEGFLQAPKTELGYKHRMKCLHDIAFYGTSDETLSEALEIANRRNYNPTAIYQLLSINESDQGNYQKAIEYHRNTLISAQGEYTDGISGNRKLAQIHEDLGFTFSYFHRYDSAAIHWHQAINYLSIGFNSNNLSDNPGPNGKFRHDCIIRYLENKAYNIYRAATESENPSIEELMVAYDTYSTAAGIIEKFRQESAPPISSIELSRRSRWIYDGIISVGYDLFRITDDPIWIQNAFIASERGKNAQLLAAHQKVRNQNFADLPEKLQLTGKKLREELAYYEGLLLASQSSDQDRILHPQWEQKVFDLKQQLSKWEQYSTEIHPEYQNDSYSPLVTYQQVQREVLQEGEVLIEFYDGWDYFWTFLVTKKDLKLFRTSYEQEPQDQIAKLTRCLNDFYFIHDSVGISYQQFTQNAYQIFKTLLAPVLDELHGADRLIIVPDAYLYQVPFEALLTDTVATDHIDYSALPYLMDSFQIQYAMSAGLLLQATRPSSLSTRSGCIAFAPNYIGSPISSRGDLHTLRSSDIPLEGAHKEVVSIADLGFPGAYYFGQEASKENFKATVDQYNLIHLALHGKADPENPDNSSLIFTKIQGDSSQDHVLRAIELQHLPLEADLVVLSACESGVGEFAPGEGAMSIARSFIAAGASSVVSTLWRIDDRTSSNLMELFYRGLADGLPISEALHTAKQKFRQKADSRTAHPYYWAGYISNGVSQPIQCKPSTGRAGWILFISTILVLILLYSGPVIGSSKRFTGSPINP